MKQKVFVIAVALLISAGITAQEASQERTKNQPRPGTEVRKQDPEQGKGQNYDQSQYKNYGQQTKAEKQARNAERKALKKAQKEAKRLEKEARIKEGAPKVEPSMEQGKNPRQNPGARPSGSTGTSPKGQRGQGPGGKNR